jgi:hypothetical protein
MLHPKEFLSRLSRLGVHTTEEDEISRRIIFSNAVLVSLPLVYLIFMVIDYQSYLRPIEALRFDQFGVPLMILVCFFCLWLNSVNITNASRILFLAIWPLLLHIVPIWLLHTPLDYFLAYPFGIAFHSMLIQLMLSRRKEKILFWSCLALNFVAMISSPRVLAYFDTDHGLPEGVVNYRYYFFDGILYWLLFNLVTFYILYVIEKYIRQIKVAKELVDEQKEELNAMNQNLEALVFKRTSELEEQNELLKKHAFFNAHLLRGPFCRVQGLLQLLPEAKQPDNEELRLKLNQSMAELDARIREIQKLVATKEEK